MKTIGLVQINNSFSGQSYLPYAAGLLEGYVKEYAKKPDAYNFLDPVYKREPVKDIKEKLRSADLVGFSTYVWNINISLKYINIYHLLPFINQEVENDPIQKINIGYNARKNSIYSVCCNNFLKYFK